MRGQAASATAQSPAPAISKTQRKHAMHALQDLGERLVELGPDRLKMLALPDELSKAVETARRMTRREARRRQLQFIGRLMREVDPAPIEAQLARWREPGMAEKARVASAEQWRGRLLTDPAALDGLCQQNPSADRAQLAALVARSLDERAHGAPPHAYRALFRALNALLG